VHLEFFLVLYVYGCEEEVEQQSERAEVCADGVSDFVGGFMVAVGMQGVRRRGCGSARLDAARGKRCQHVMCRWSRGGPRTERGGREQQGGVRCEVKCVLCCA
jgi:hypothetical protein